MHTSTSIHNVTSIRSDVLRKSEEEGLPYYWRTFFFTTNDGGLVSVTAFADNPAALPEFPNPTRKEQTA